MFETRGEMLHTCDMAMTSFMNSQVVSTVAHLIVSTIQSFTYGVNDSLEVTFGASMTYQIGSQSLSTIMIVITTTLDLSNMVQSVTLSLTCLSTSFDTAPPTNNTMPIQLMVP